MSDEQSFVSVLMLKSWPASLGGYFVDDTFRGRKETGNWTGDRRGVSKVEPGQ